MTQSGYKLSELIFPRERMENYFSIKEKIVEEEYTFKVLFAIPFSFRIHTYDLILRYLG